MYDPARDIFTSSEDAGPDSHDAEGHLEPGPSIEQERQSGALEASQPVTQAESAAEKVSPVPEVDGEKLLARPFADSGITQPQLLSSPPDPSPAASMLNETSRKRSHSAEPKPEAMPNGTEDIVRNGEGHAVSEREPGDGSDARQLKKLKSSDPSEYASPTPLHTANLPRFSKKRSEDGENDRANISRNRPSQTQSRRDRERSPRRYRSRSPRRSPEHHRRRERRRTPPRRSPSPYAIPREPSPPPRSPPRKLKRPGGASRINADQKEAIRQRQIEREQEQARRAQQVAATRGVHDVVRQHYNTVPERGREWRKTDSRIKGLRSFNNWVKSTIIQKFSPNEDFSATPENTGWDDNGERSRGLLVLDLGCGKGGDLGKWAQAPQPVELYVGIDPAEISIDQARDRYSQMRGGGGRGGSRGGRKRVFHAEFFNKDGFGEWLGDIPFLQDVGIDSNVGPGRSSRWGGGGFDVVSMMFCMHYAFENETKARGMLRNVAGALKKGGRFLGVIPNSDVLSQKVQEFHARRAAKAAQTVPGEEKPEETKQEPEDGEVAEQNPDEDTLNFGNEIYSVRFPPQTTQSLPANGVFRPPFGWKYSYFMLEAVEGAAVEGVPEYVVPWEAFRALAEDYNLELQYRKPFRDVWKEESDDPVLGPLAERMGVTERGSNPPMLQVSEEELEAASFYHAFCFYKV